MTPFDLYANIFLPVCISIVFPLVVVPSLPRRDGVPEVIRDALRSKPQMGVTSKVLLA